MDWSQFGDFPLAGHRAAVAPQIDGEEDAVWAKQEKCMLIRDHGMHRGRILNPITVI